MTITDLKTTQKAKQYIVLQLNINIETEKQILYIHTMNTFKSMIIIF